MYSYSYIDDQGFERTVYIENAASIAHKLNLLDAYNARDVALVVNPSGDTDPNIWNILYQFQNNGESDHIDEPHVGLLYGLRQQRQRDRAGRASA